MALAFLSGALVACDTGTGPGSLAEFDAEAALEDYRTLDRVLGSEGWKGFLAMGGAVSMETFGPAVEIALSAPRDLRGLRDGRGARALATRLLAAGAREPHAAAAPAFIWRALPFSARNTRTPAVAAATAVVASLLPPSTTSTSRGRCGSTLASVVAMRASSLSAGMMTEIMPPRRCASER